MYDFPLIMYTFMSRDIYVVTADVLYKLKSLKLFLPQIGAIKVRRDDHDFAFLKKVEKLLNKRKVCLFFPESFINGV
ncbi:MAG: hypothetical protein MJ223_02575 [Mycoplasmoidaceae bacterium]|nr:hypothetical protein [Mycoplasmoidaceae bacterium]